MSGLSSSVGRPLPTRYQYIINEEYAGKQGYFGNHITYNDLLLSKGPDAQDWTDISEMAKRFYNETNGTLSEDLNPFYEMIAASGGVQDVNHNYVRWKVFGKPEREIRSYGNPNPAEADCLGAQGTKFKVRLDTPFLKPGNIIAPNVNKQCLVKIVSECFPAGGAYDYEAVMWEKDATFPVEFFKPGMIWIKEGAMTSHRQSGEAGGTEFGVGFSYVEFEIPMTTMQWEYSVTEEAWLEQKHIRVSRCNLDGRPDPLQEGGGLTNLMEMKMRETIKKEKELYLVYGRSTRDQTDTISGTEQTSSPGLMEYMQQAQEVPYSPTTNGIDKMVAELKAMWFDTTSISRRNVVLYTGEAGLELWHRWIEEKFGNTVTMTTEDLVLGTSEPFEPGRRGKSFGGYQFTKYHLPIFGSISVKHWSLLDNTRVNGVKMPNSYYPVSSYEFWAFDIGHGEPNIKLLTRSGKERSEYLPGSIGPNGYVGPSNPIFKQRSLTNFDGYKWRHRTSFGLVVMRPDAVVRFLPAVV